MGPWACPPSEDSDQSAHLLSLIGALTFCPTIANDPQKPDVEGGGSDNLQGFAG